MASVSLQGRQDHQRWNRTPAPTCVCSKAFSILLRQIMVFGHPKKEETLELCRAPLALPHRIDTLRELPGPGCRQRGVLPTSEASIWT